MYIGNQVLIRAKTGYSRLVRILHRPTAAGHFDLLILVLQSLLI